MIGMMVTVDAVEHFDTHAKKTGRFPFVDAGLHEPMSPPCGAACAE
jgi:hypothetical protein